MSATHLETASTPLGSEQSRIDVDVGVLYVTDVPRPVLRALSILGAAQDMSRSGYVRELVERHTTETEA